MGEKARFYFAYAMRMLCMCGMTVAGCGGEIQQKLSRLGLTAFVVIFK